MAVVAMIARRGGESEDFGFIGTRTDAKKLVPWADKLGPDPQSIELIDFRTAARAAAHRKAKAWLDERKK